MKKVLKVIAICAIVALVSFCGYILIKDIKNNFNNKNGCKPAFMVGKILEINNNNTLLKLFLIRHRHISVEMLLRLWRI